MLLYFSARDKQYMDFYLRFLVYDALLMLYLYTRITNLWVFNVYVGDSVFVGPSHHGMARPQVAEGVTASDMEGSCEYIE